LFNLDILLYKGYVYSTEILSVALAEDNPKLSPEALTVQAYTSPPESTLATSLMFISNASIPPEGIVIGSESNNEHCTPELFRSPVADCVTSGLTVASVVPILYRYTVTPFLSPLEREMLFGEIVTGLSRSPMFLISDCAFSNMSSVPSVKNPLILSRKANPTTNSAIPITTIIIVLIESSIAPFFFPLILLNLNILLYKGYVLDYSYFFEIFNKREIDNRLMKLRNFIFFLVFFVILSMGVLAVPSPDYYNKYDFFPLHLSTAYDVYPAGEEILIYLDLSFSEVSKEHTKNWTFQFESEEYPVRSLVAYQFVNKSYVKIPLFKNGEDYSFEFLDRFNNLMLLVALEGKGAALNISKLPMIIYPTKSDINLKVHQEEEVLDYDFRNNGGYHSYTFQEQVRQLEDLVEKQPANIVRWSEEYVLLSAISLNRNSWLSDDIFIAQGYNQSLQEFVDFHTGGEYLYPDQVNSQKEAETWTAVLIILFGAIILGGIYLLIKRKRK
jgi:hypothetical protein